MAQPAAIDPVQLPTPARANTPRGKLNSNFARALDETRDLSKNKIENCSNGEHTSTAQNSQRTKERHETPTPRKAVHGGHRVSEPKENATQSQEVSKPEDEITPSAHDSESENLIQSESKASTDASGSAGDDKTTDEQADTTEETFVETLLPQESLTQNTTEKSSPSSQPALESQQQQAESSKINSEIETTNFPLSKQADSIHSEGPKFSEIEDGTAKDDKIAIDNDHILADNESETDESNTEKTETEPKKSDASEKPTSKAEGSGPYINSEFGARASSISGTSHPFHHFLTPDTTSATLPSLHAPSDSSKSSPVPYHTLPIEIGLRALDGAKEIMLDIAPNELGQLNIRIVVDDQSAIQVSILTEKPQTLALLQHDASHIRHALEQAGYSIPDSSLQFSLQSNLSSNSNSSRDDQRKQASRHTSDTDLESGEIETATPTRQRIYLNQLDLSV